MITVLIVFLFLGLGILSGYLGRKKTHFINLFKNISMLAIFILLFFLGAGLGNDTELFLQLPKIGLEAFIMTCTVCIGSVIFTLPLQKFFNKAHKENSVEKKEKDEEKERNNQNEKSLSLKIKSPDFTDKKAGSSVLRDKKADNLVLRGKKAGSSDLTDKKAGSSALISSLRIALFFALGILAARLEILPDWVYNEKLIDYSLWLLVYSVGVSLGSEIQAFAIVKEMPVLLLAVPLLVVAGSLCSISLLALLCGESIKDFITVASGFGYYSLSSIIVDQSGNSYLATLTLLSNLLRELMGILLTPLLSRFFGTLSPVSFAGAPAMDVCLPMIAKYSGEKEAISAVISGMLLTLFVPFMVSFFVYF